MAGRAGLSVLVVGSPTSMPLSARQRVASSAMTARCGPVTTAWRTLSRRREVMSLGASPTGCTCWLPPVPDCSPEHRREGVGARARAPALVLVDWADDKPGRGCGSCRRCVLQWRCRSHLGSESPKALGPPQAPECQHPGRAGRDLIGRDPRGHPALERWWVSHPAELTLPPQGCLSTCSTHRLPPCRWQGVAGETHARSAGWGPVKGRER